MKFTRPQANLANLVNTIGAMIVVYLIVMLVQTVKKNYDLGQQAKVLEAETSLLKAQAEDLTYNIQYYNTDSFRDREARAKLGLQLPGENVVIIPRSSATPSPGNDTSDASRRSPSHFSQWLNFLLGRN